MKCADIMSKNLEWLNEKDTVRQAAAVMADAGIGFLPICDKWKKVVGVITDRDLATRGLAKKVDPDKTSAALIMSSPVVTCLETADVRDAEALMANERKSRLVVTDAEGVVVGILSLADLVEHASGRESLKTVRAVLWREALGPRGRRDTRRSVAEGRSHRAPAGARFRRRRAASHGLHGRTPRRRHQGVPRLTVDFGAPRGRLAPPSPRR